MFSSLRLYVIIIVFFLLSSCKTHEEKNAQLLFWCSNNPREINFCTGLTDDWNIHHIANAIHLQPIPEGQSSEEVILAAVVGKTTPDIYANMWQGNVEMYARSGVLIPLDTLKGFLQFIHERCDSTVIKEITSVDGHIYQVPWKVNPFMTIYNKNLFAENGVTDLPTTYSTYLRDAETFKNNTRKNGEQKWFGYTAVREIWYERLFSFYPLYLAASGGAPLIVNNKAAFNNKYAVEVFRFLQTIYTNGYFTRENLQTSNDPFVAQQIATTFTGPYETNFLLGIPGRNFGFDYFPIPVPDDYAGPVYTYADPKNIVVFNTCKHPQEAWDFIHTLIDKQGDLKLLEITGQLPSRKNLDTDIFYSDFFKRNPMLIPFAKQIPFVKGVDNCEVIVEALDIISQEYAACVIYGKKTPEKAIQDAEAAVNILLADNAAIP
jgi:multiple sugar transport system substrate-binding protein